MHLIPYPLLQKARLVRRAAIIQRTCRQLRKLRLLILRLLKRLPLDPLELVVGLKPRALALRVKPLQIVLLILSEGRLAGRQMGDRLFLLLLLIVLLLALEISALVVNAQRVLELRDLGHIVRLEVRASVVLIIQQNALFVGVLHLFLGEGDAGDAGVGVALLVSPLEDLVVELLADAVVHAEGGVVDAGDGEGVGGGVELVELVFDAVLVSAVGAKI